MDVERLGMVGVALSHRLEIFVSEHVMAKVVFEIV
jgi:hypothetical protein